MLSKKKITQVLKNSYTDRGGNASKQSIRKNLREVLYNGKDEKELKYNSLQRLDKLTQELYKTAHPQTQKKPKEPKEKKDENKPFLGSKNDIFERQGKKKEMKPITPYNPKVKMNYQNTSTYFFATDTFLNNIITENVFAGVKKIFLPNGVSYDRSNILDLEKKLRSMVKDLNKLKINSKDFPQLSFTITGREMYIELDFPLASKYNYSSDLLV